jgi:glycosyltransferase involved in cell wall biosynthesis
MSRNYHQAAQIHTPVELPRKLILATHYWAFGPAIALREYLEPRAEQLLFIAHPIAGAQRSYFRLYAGGQLVKEEAHRPLAGSARYLQEAYRTVKWASRNARNFQIFIAGDSFLALAGLWLRWRRRVQYVVLYTVDFVPRRFPNAGLNRVYHSVDSFAVRRANVVWNASRAIELARRERDGPVRTAPQIVVPVGAHFQRIRRLPLAEANPRSVAFVGHLLEKQGLQIVIEAWPIIRAAVPGATLLVIGDGPFRGALETQARRLGVADAIEFFGYTDDQEEIERRLVPAALAVAPYLPDPLSFTRFADPTKLKTYLACGLPIILTDVPPNARQIEQAGAGSVVSYTADAFAHAIVSYLTDRNKLEQGRRAAVELGATFDWDRVFTDAWNTTEPLLR